EAPLFLIERGAARYFGVRTWAAHVNGIVHREAGAQMWLARRSRQKAVDPGLLDNLVGGGIAAGFRVDQTVVKEAWEEAGIPAPLARAARPASYIRASRRSTACNAKRFSCTISRCRPTSFPPIRTARPSSIDLSASMQRRA